MDNAEVSDFFSITTANIATNRALRDPQREAYEAIHQHFTEEKGPCYVQLPVGCGKTGLIGITPFGNADGRVLILVPNITIRDTVLRELNVSSPDCFYATRGVFTPTNGPFITELKTTANQHDCDNAHFVIANIQQFAGINNRWYEKFSQDYFRMILVDEGHHNVAESWRRLFEHFDKAKIVSYTATPLRSDGQRVLGKRVYTFGYARSMMMGFISPIDAVYVSPRHVTFTVDKKTTTLELSEVLEMREKDWFSKGIALSEECNRHIVEASLRQLYEVRKHGEPRQIIAVACSIRHAVQVASLYHEHGLHAEVLHSGLEQSEKDRIEASLRQGTTDVVVQVQMLGEGYNLPTLAVAAVFRPYRSLAPFVQFIGRILRLANPECPASPGNRVYVVSHVGLNDERWWSDFTEFDKEDQDFFSEYLGTGESEIEGTENTGRLTLRPFMRVLNETVEDYIKRGYLTHIDESMVHEVLETIRSKGFDPSEFGLSEEVMRVRLELAAQEQRQIPAFKPLVQPQKRKEALRTRTYQEARSIADTVINRLGFRHAGRDLIRTFPGKGMANSQILIQMAQAAQNKVMGVESGQRDEASIEQFEKAVEESANIVDSLTQIVRQKQRENHGKNKVDDKEV